MVALHCKTAQQATAHVFGNPYSTSKRIIKSNLNAFFVGVKFSRQSRFLQKYTHLVLTGYGITKLKAPYEHPLTYCVVGLDDLKPDDCWVVNGVGVPVSDYKAVLRENRKRVNLFPIGVVNCILKNDRGGRDRVHKSDASMAHLHGGGDVVVINEISVKKHVKVV